MKGKNLAVFVLLALSFLALVPARAQSLGPNGHYYKIVLESNLSWEEARIEAAESTLNGVHGYLATVTSLEEDQFIFNLWSSSASNKVVWLGGSQATNASSSAANWFWVNGEGSIAGSNAEAIYANWLPGEPNDLGGANSEQFLAIGATNSFGWSSMADLQAGGYVVEYNSAGVGNKVSLRVIDPIAVEDATQAAQTNTAVFEFRREGNLSVDLAVFFSVGGTATKGADYEDFSQSLIIPAGESSARLTIIPRVDMLAVVEPMETVGIRVEPSPILTPEASYDINPLYREAAAVIYEQRPPQSGALEIAVPRGGSTYALGESVSVIAVMSLSNAAPTVEFWGTEIDTGMSNKIGAAFGVQRTNELAFYKFAWTNAPAGDFYISARATVGEAASVLQSSPVWVRIVGTNEPTTVSIRYLESTNAVPSTNSDYILGQLEVSRVGPTNYNLQVFYTTSGSAMQGEDYEALSGYVVIGAGRRSAKVPFAPLDDLKIEGTEFLTLQLLPGTNIFTGEYQVDVEHGQATIPIFDNETSEPPPTNVVITLEATETNAKEPTQWAVAGGEFKLTRSGSTTRSLQVNMHYGGSATAGLDYVALPNPVTFEAGISETLLQVRPLADDLFETNETVVAELAAGTNYTVSATMNRAVVTIQDTTTPPATNDLVWVAGRVHFTSESIDGVNYEPGEIAFYRTGPTVNQPLRVYFEIGGTAQNGVDYIALTNYVDFQAGQTEAVLKVYALKDELSESRETVILTIKESATYRIDPDNRSGGVEINDTSGNLVSVRASRPETSEPTPTTEPIPGEFTFRRIGLLTNELRVGVSIRGTATNGYDFVTLSNYVVFAANQAETTMRVTALADGLVEGDETVVAVVTYPPAGGPYYRVDTTNQLATVVIHDSTNTTTTNIFISVEATQPNAWEPNASSNAVAGRFTFRRSGPTNTTVEAKVFWGGSAKLNSDYTANTNAVVFVAGSAEVQRYVSPLADDLVETNETVGVQIISSGNVKADPERYFATVIIHDTTVPTEAPFVSLEVLRGETHEPGSNVVVNPGLFQVRREGPTNAPLVVTLNYSGTATWGVDYAASNTVVIPAGRYEQSFAVIPFADDLVEGQERVVATLETNSPAFKANPNKLRGVVTIIDEDGPKVVILKPVDGAVFLTGELINVVADATPSVGATITNLQIIVAGRVAGATGPDSTHVDLGLGGFEPGEYTLYARAYDSAGYMAQASVRFLVRRREEVSFVQRNLPGTYSPGVALTVELRATPPDGAQAYAVEDQPPKGWVVGEISHGGAFDALNGKVKFGPYTDSTNRTLTYKLTPPGNATGKFTFTGSSSVNGGIYPILGDDTLELIQVFHPADLNQNFAIYLAEVTGYAAAWKSGTNWPVGPNPIPLAYVTSAGSIWKRGEIYHFDPSRPAPACWVPTNTTAMLLAAAAETLPIAQRIVPTNCQAGVAVDVSIIANPPATSASYAIEEKPPVGWTVSNISGEGTLDAASGTIRWGVFFDAQPRTLTYTLTPPAGVASLGVFKGDLSFDGRVVEISAASVSVEGPEPIQITAIENTSEGVRFQVSGPPGQTAVIESTTDFQTWAEVQSIFIPEGSVGYTTGVAATGGSSANVFYRLRVQ